jgi:hypothetical protein
LSTTLRDKLAMYICYGQKIMNHALNGWSVQHETEKKNEKTGAFYYPDVVYDKL